MIKKLSAAVKASITSLLALAFISASFVGCNPEATTEQPVDTTVAVSSVTVTSDSDEVAVGGTLALTANVLPENATDKTVTWSSADTEKATVSETGVVTGVAAGEVVITATAGEKHGTITITVKAASQGGDSDVVPVESVTITTTAEADEDGEFALYVDETLAFTAEVLPANATNKTVTWSSSDTEVATVSNGTVIGIKEGVVTITATCGEKSASKTVNVSVKPAEVIPATDITITSADKVYVGKKLTFTATVTPDNATDKTVTWSVDKLDLATISANGELTAAATGKVVVTATCGEITKTKEITIEEAPAEEIHVTSVAINEAAENISLDIGSTRTFSVTVLPADATDPNVSWSTSDAEIATVEGGKVTGVKEGTVTITATSDDDPTKKATVTIQVKTPVVPVTSVVITGEDTEVVEGQTITLGATVLPSNATDKTVTWTSSDPTKATVEDGVVTGVAEGTVTITATAGDKEATKTITVKAAAIAVESVAITGDAEVTVGGTLQLSATVHPADATDKSVTWSSNPSAKATVDQTGKVTAIEAGEVTITATAGGKTATKTITVKAAAPAEVPVTEVTIATPAKTTLKVGDTLQLSATVTPANATNKTLYWHTDDEDVATVDDDGLVTAVGAGDVTIDVTWDGDEEIIDTVDLSVEDEESTATAELPIIVTGTKIEGAGIMIKLDNTSLGISGANAADIMSGLQITLSDGEFGAVSPQFDDYGVGTVRIYFTLNSAKSDLSVTIKGPINGTNYESTIDFVGGIYLPADYEVEELTLAPSGKQLKASDTLQFTAKDQYAQPADVTWTATVGEIDEDGLYTAPDTVAEETEVTITATYSEEVSKTITLTLLADDEEIVLPPWTISIENAAGAGAEFTFKWTDANNALAANTSTIVNFKLGTNAMNGVGWCDARKGAGSITAYMHTHGADWNNTTPKAFYCRIQTAAGLLYDINGTFAITGTDDEVTEATFTAVKMITLSESRVEIEEINDTESVEVSAVGFELESSKISATSGDTEVATVEVSGSNVVVTAVSNGNATITVSYDMEGIESKTFDVHVGAFVFAATPDIEDENAFFFLCSSGEKTIDVAGLNKFCNWSQTTVASDVAKTAAGVTRTLYQMAGLNYQGWQFSSVDISSYTKICFDYYTADSTALSVYPILEGSGEYNIAVSSMEKDAWVHVELTMDPENANYHDTINQIKFVGNGTLLIDNFYLK